MKKIFLATATVLLFAAPAFAGNGRYRDDHQSDHREHRGLHRDYVEDHEDAHDYGFRNRREHREFHRDYEADHNDFHDEHPNTRHDDSRYYGQSQYRSYGSYNAPYTNRYPDVGYGGSYPLSGFSFGYSWRN